MIIEFLTVWAELTILIIAAFFAVRAIERKLERMLGKSPKPSAISGEQPVSKRVVVRYRARADLRGGKKFRVR